MKATKRIFWKVSSLNPGPTDCKWQVWNLNPHHNTCDVSISSFPFMLSFQRKKYCWYMTNYWEIFTLCNHLMGCEWKSLSCVGLFVTPWTVQSMKFSRPETELGSSALQGDSLPAELPGKPMMQSIQGPKKNFFSAWLLQFASRLSSSAVFVYPWDAKKKMGLERQFSPGMMGKVGLVKQIRQTRASGSWAPILFSGGTHWPESLGINMWFRSVEPDSSNKLF